MIDSLLSAGLWIVGVLGVFLASTVAFDVVHWLLHRFMDSRVGLLRAVGSLHATHHRFLDRELVIHTELIPRNIAQHVIPEYLTQVAFTLALLWVLPAHLVWPALGLQTLVAALILRSRGMDVNHRGVAAVKAHRPLVFCVPEYHALHHVHPEAHFSSWVKLLDFLLGTGACIRGRRFAVTGAETCAGNTLARRLRERGAAEVASIGDAVAAAPDLRAIDVLVLCHAPDSAGTSHDEWVEAFCAAARGRLLPPEVWAREVWARGVWARGVWARGIWASEIWARGSAARVGRDYFRDDRVIYRRLDAGREADPERSADRALAGISRGLYAVRA